MSLQVRFEVSVGGDPCTRHAFTSMPFIGSNLAESCPLPGAMDFVDGLRSIAGKAEAGDMTFVSRMLATQAVALDTIFGEFTRRSSLNMGSHLDAAERYARLALKAQANSRATLEALAKLHQPREQIVRHVHVNDGGQAIVGGSGQPLCGRGWKCRNRQTIPCSRSAWPMLPDVLPGRGRATRVSHRR